jgi:site-specific DNA-methyltransferase (adenine-specific)
MKPTLTIRNAVIYQGNNLEVLPTLPDNSVDSIVCDPPYELGFMGKTWDSSGIAYSVELWKECLRVLKPGGHLLAFGGTRTWHRLAVAVEDAGFEIRDNIAWLYGSGFPKSHNISKAIDKAAGAEREVIGDKYSPDGIPYSARYKTAKSGGILGKVVPANPLTQMETAPATDDAKAWDGWGTALKPAHEPIVVARKPVEGTVAQNVLEHGVGGLNIDATRIGTETRLNASAGNKDRDSWRMNTSEVEGRESVGRWPANIILDEYTAELLDEQSGVLKSGAMNSITKGHDQETFNTYGKQYVRRVVNQASSGGASRFFYVAKASKRDRNEGLDELPEVRHADRNATDGVGGDNPRNRTNQAKQNFHPTVKPTALMQYLIRLVTPANGVVLDPFAGSGSTGKAAILENKHFIGIELTAEYLPIIEGRLTHAYETLDSKEDLFE